MNQCPEFPRYMTQFKIGSHVKVAPNWKRRAVPFSISPPSLWETLCNIDSLKASSHGRVAPLSVLLFCIIFQQILKTILFWGVHYSSPPQEQELLVYREQLQAWMLDREQGSSSLRKSLFGTSCRTVGHCYFDILINGTQVFIIDHSRGCLLKYHKKSP